jgi:hypothetical protein
MRKKTKRFNMKASEDFLGKLQKISETLDKPASEVVREAVNEKIEALAEANPKVAEALGRVV